MYSKHRRRVRAFRDSLTGAVGAIDSANARGSNATLALARAHTAQKNGRGLMPRPIHGRGGWDDPAEPSSNRRQQVCDARGA